MSDNQLPEAVVVRLDRVRALEEQLVERVDRLAAIGQISPEATEWLVRARALALSQIQAIDDLAAGGATDARRTHVPRGNGGSEPAASFLIEDIAGAVASVVTAYGALYATGRLLYESAVCNLADAHAVAWRPEMRAIGDLMVGRSMVICCGVASPVAVSVPPAASGHACARATASTPFAGTRDTQPSNQVTASSCASHRVQEANWPRRVLPEAIGSWRSMVRSFTTTPSFSRPSGAIRSARRCRSGSSATAGWTRSGSLASATCRPEPARTGAWTSAGGRLPRRDSPDARTSDWERSQVHLTFPQIGGD